MKLMRSLIERIELTPREGGGVDALVHGDLARILTLFSTGAEEAKPLRTARVAGFRYDEAPDAFGVQGLSMSLEGPAFVLPWCDAAHDDGSGVVAPERIETIAELPYQLHVDHPEGIELWPEAGAGALLIIYDAPAPERTDPATSTVRADVICPGRATPRAN
jgi:hypothetical protein